MLFFNIFLLVILSFNIFAYKSIVLKIIMLILFYPLLVLFLYMQNFPMLGILELNRFEFSEQDLLFGYYYYLIGYILFVIIVSPLKKVSYGFYPIKIGNKTRALIFVLLCISVIPVLNIHVDSATFKSATFYLCLNSLLLLSFRKERNWIYYAQLVLLVVIIIKGERVDSLMCVILLFILTQKGYVVEKSMKPIMYIYGILFFFLLVIIAYLRDNRDFNYLDLIISIYSQQTVCDVVYVYLTGVKYYLLYGVDWNVLLNIFFGLIPGVTSGVSSPYFYSNILRNFMDNPGGGLFFTEGILLFGGVGIIMYIALYGIVIKMLFVRNYGFYRILFVLFIIMQCRLIWYGMQFMYKPLFLLFIAYLFFKRNKGIQVYK